MATLPDFSGILQYENQSRIKWIVVIFSAMITAGTIIYTSILVNTLREREARQIELFARALEYTINEDFDNNLFFIIQEVLAQNTSIPTILVNEAGEIESHKNLNPNPLWPDDRKEAYLNRQLEKMKKRYPPLAVSIRDPMTNEIYGTQYVYYENSFLLTQLTWYPYIQLSVIAVFALVAYLAFSYSKAAEQNRVWVGLAKETAHQLGTPLSSLMAWLEHLKKEKGLEDKGLIKELEKDIQKLEIITERFSNIGATAHLKLEPLEDIINNTVDYLRSRISSRVEIRVEALNEGIQARINAPLFEWVIENLVKNAVDAMGGTGNLSIRIIRGGDSKVFIDLSDTGKGIPKSKIQKVFNPGFTTKKRGWGLGLTLVKRIIENYHEGKIHVKHSEENKGTTFRIELKA